LRLHYTISVAVSGLVAVSLVALYIAPRFTVELCYLQPENVGQNTVLYLKITYLIANGFLTLAWIMASMMKKSSINEMDIVFDEEDDIDFS
jgi:hypothetical protein